MIFAWLDYGLLYIGFNQIGLHYNGLDCSILKVYSRPSIETIPAVETTLPVSHFT